MKTNEKQMAYEAPETEVIRLRFENPIATNGTPDIGGGDNPGEIDGPDD